VTTKKRIDIAMAISVRAAFAIFHEHSQLEAAALEKMQHTDPSRWKTYTALWKPFPMKGDSDTKQEELDTPTTFCDRCITTPAESECPHCAHNFCDWCLLKKHQRRCRNGVARTLCVTAATVAAAAGAAAGEPPHPPHAIHLSPDASVGPAMAERASGEQGNANLGSDSEESDVVSDDSQSDHEQDADPSNADTGHEDGDIDECPMCGTVAQLIETLCCSQVQPPAWSKVGRKSVECWPKVGRKSAEGFAQIWSNFAPRTNGPSWVSSVFPLGIVVLGILGRVG
jgi:hypothetical protein